MGQVLSINASLHPARDPSTMLRWAIIFAVLALVAGVLGFGGLAGDFSYIAKILLLIFVVLVVVSLIFGRGSGPPVV